MANFKKRAFSLFVALVMVISMLPVNHAHADQTPPNGVANGYGQNQGNGGQNGNGNAYGATGGQPGGPSGAPDGNSGGDNDNTCPACGGAGGELKFWGGVHSLLG